VVGEEEEDEGWANAKSGGGEGSAVTLGAGWPHETMSHAAMLREEETIPGRDISRLVHDEREGKYLYTLY
jgi:hypothetical protein